MPMAPTFLTVAVAHQVPPPQHLLAPAVLAALAGPTRRARHPEDDGGHAPRARSSFRSGKIMFYTSKCNHYSS